MFTKGQRVKRPVKWYWINNDVNPGEVGVILEVYPNQEFCYDIQWDRGHRNSYRERDVEPYDTRPLEEQVKDLLG